VTIFAATNGFTDGFGIDSLAKFETELFSFMKDRHGALLAEIGEKKQITDEIKAKLSAALEEFKGMFKEE
jgi:F-type H+-transporting ATPase subunit alpha